MAKKKCQIAMRLMTDLLVDMPERIQVSVRLPDGCVGVLYAFESVEKGQDFYNGEIETTFLQGEYVEAEEKGEE